MQLTFDVDGVITATTGSGARILSSTSPYDATVWARMLTLQSIFTSAELTDPIGFFSNNNTVLGVAGPDNGILPTPSNFGCRSFPCGAGRLIVDSMLYQCQVANAPCDIGLVNGGVPRRNLTQSINRLAGMALLPFFGNIVSMDVPGSTVRTALVSGIGQGTGSGGFPQTNVHFVFNPIENPAVPGIDFAGRVMDIKVPNRLTGALEDLDDSKTYRIVMNVFVFNGGNGYNMFKPPVNFQDLGASQLEAFVNYLQAKSSLEHPFTQYPDVSEDAACVAASAPIGSGSTCTAALTTQTRTQYETCPTDEGFCTTGANGTYILPGIFVQSDCKTCSGLGRCSQRACSCSVSGYALDGTYYSMTSGVPSTGFYAGVLMVRGDDCSNVRLVWQLNERTKHSMFAAAGLTIVVSLLFAGLLVKYLDKPVIRATSPTFSIIACAAGIIAAMGIIVDALEITPTTCNASLWLHLMAFVTLFGCIFIKTYRLDYIFNNKTLMSRRTKLTDKRLLGYVLVIVLCEAIVLIIHQVVTPLEIRPTAMEPFEVATVCGSSSSILTVILIIVNGMSPVAPI